MAPLYECLRSVRVLDFSRYIAGPLCAAQLADLGADVIRVELPGGGEDRTVYPVTDGGDGALFLQMNRNKRGITLDTRAPGGEAPLQRLVASADIIVTSLPAEAQRALGLDYASLRAFRPDIILTPITAFGADGPYSGRPGFDGVGQAMCGAVWLSGLPGTPFKSFASWVDVLTGIFAAQATLAALITRMQTGEGQELDCNLFASALSAMNFPLIEQALTGIDRQATGNRAQSGGPADMFRTRDGWIMAQVIGNPMFRRWAKLIGAEQLIDDPRFANDGLRSANGAELSKRMNAWTSRLTSREALDALGKARIPGGPVLSPQEVLEDEHVRDADVFTAMPYPGAPAEIPLVLGAVKAAGARPSLHRRAPLPGEHNEEVYGALGYSADEIAALRQNRTI